MFKHCIYTILQELRDRGFIIHNGKLVFALWLMRLSSSQQPVEWPVSQKKDYLSLLRCVMSGAARSDLWPQTHKACVGVGGCGSLYKTHRLPAQNTCGVRFFFTRSGTAGFWSGSGTDLVCLVSNTWAGATPNTYRHKIHTPHATKSIFALVRGQRH